MENLGESMEEFSPSVDIEEEIRRLMEQFTTPTSPMDAQIQNTEVLAESIEVESELGIPDMKIFEQKTTQEGDASTHSTRITGSFGALGVHDYTEHFTTEKLYMRSGFPMPLIALNWQRYRKTYATGWDASFGGRIEEFGRIIDSDVATAQSFDIVE